MPKLHLDFETFSEVDIRSAGTYRYAEDPSTEILLAAWAVDDGPVQQWDATTELVMPANLRRLLQSRKYTIHAFNAPFERQILKQFGIDLPPERFKCEMVHAYAFAFSGNLDDVVSQIGLPADKQKLKDGKKLIQKFCKPQPQNYKIRRHTSETSPEEWEQFKEYNRQDIEAERAVAEFLDQYHMRERDWENWYLDQRINDRGLPIDLKFVRAAIRRAKKEISKRLNTMARITKLQNPNSRDQLLGWLRSKGVEIDNLQASTVDNTLQGNIRSPLARKVLLLKQEISKASVTKYSALERATCADGYLRGAFQFFGASRTGRWAGRLFQPQNLTRQPEGYANEEIVAAILADMPLEEPIQHLSYSVRSSIKAPPGMSLSVSDLAGIEGRGLPWLCFYKEKLDKIDAGLDMYVEAAKAIYHTDAIDSFRRSVGKVAELALGYQGGLAALNKMAKLYGLPPFRDDEGWSIVRAWRASNQPIVQFWYMLEDAAVAAIENYAARENVFDAHRISFYVEGDFLFMELPGGRNLAYYKPQLTDDGKVSYMGLNTYTRKWERVYTYGGKLAENATQAISYDVLTENMPKIETAGFTLIGTVHDEDITLNKRLKKFDSKALDKLMALRPPWAQDLPLKAKGYTATRYKKD